MEAEFHCWLQEHVPENPNFALGLGDDAALMSLGPRRDLVVTTDLLSDGVDFRLERDEPRRIGRKALAVNLSDLAAMAAKPMAAAVSIALPRKLGSDAALQLAIALYEGLLPLAAEFGAAIAGGDTNSHDGPLVLSITAFGEVTERGPLTRRGGRAGDKLLVTGSLGGSIAGHHFDFTPRVRESLLLHESYDLHAGMDISDGLALDLSRLAQESGCGAVLHVDRIPRTPNATLENALSDGEDFELLLAAPAAVADVIVRDQPVECGVTCIGELVADSGLWQQTSDGIRAPLEPRGWQH